MAHKLTQQKSNFMESHYFKNQQINRPKGISALWGDFSLERSHLSLFSIWQSEMLLAHVQMYKHF